MVLLANSMNFLKYYQTNLLLHTHFQYFHYKFNYFYSINYFFDYFKFKPFHHFKYPI